ncbi:uncharacterized protein N7482_000465 [Penicillium canariense]|uniref:Uncharacterized protein n=1 Tax=Penicillium canariense TaxID=189055 RepID=A0A9W9LS16_9EURO|nr:uncharacterized protein N7482_000465 [Penicillium canariense]KAJ5174588.1 hypothetical protein N7482_000465 [Penicillium canariense]
MDGNIRWDGVSGDTDSEIAQKRANLVNDEIHRPARKIQTISDEQWDKWVEEARERRILRGKAEQDERVRQYVREERIKLQTEQAKEYEDQLARDVDRDAKHRLWYEAFFNQFHDPDDPNEFSEGTWKTVYYSVSWYLMKMDAVYNWTQTTQKVYLLHRLRKSQNRITEEESQYFYGVATRKDPKTGNQVSWP